MSLSHFILSGKQKGDGQLCLQLIELIEILQEQMACMLLTIHFHL